ncbi:MAG: hypothetical protein M3N19_10355 [Candidatus Eremiobacteraeota bacterium]|nr:hypothetical protein [Candidatus Eremiobacteraeota bacterium]
MDLDELKTKWTEHDGKLDQLIQINRSSMNAIAIKPARTAVAWLQVSLVIEIVFACASVVLLGSFIADNIRDLRFAVPAALLDIGALTVLGVVVRQLVVTAQIDYAEPITAIQKKLEAVRVLRIRHTQGIFLTAVLAWSFLYVVLFRALFGLDAYAIFGVAYFWANVGFGLTVAAVAIWVAKTFGDRLGQTRLLKFLVQSLNGRSINLAAAALAKIAEFETEPAA